MGKYLNENSKNSPSFEGGVFRIACPTIWETAFAPLFFYPNSGNYYTMPTTGASITSATQALTADQIRAIPFPVGRNLTIDRIGAEVTSASAAGTKARLGIYDSLPNGNPNSLILDAGEIATDSTGYKSITISQALTGGTLYWLVILSQSTPTVRGIASAEVLCPFGGEPGNPGTDSRKPAGTVTSAYGALPSTFGTNTFSGSCPAIWVRIV